MKSVWNMTCMFYSDAFGPCAQGPDGIVSEEYMCVWKTSKCRMNLCLPQ